MADTDDLCAEACVICLSTEDSETKHKRLVVVSTEKGKKRLKTACPCRKYGLHCMPACI